MTTATTTTCWPTSALSAAQTAFETLTTEPSPVLVLDTAVFGEDLSLPAGAVALAYLRDWLLLESTGFEARDAVWREVLVRAKATGPEAGTWQIGAVGLAMPALLSHARTLGEGYRGDPDDLDAEILTGFLAALRGQFDVSRPAPYARLIFAAERAGRQARMAEDRYVPTPDVPSCPGSREPRNPTHHEDLLVARAAELKLLDDADAAAWIEVRLSRIPVEFVAADLGVTADCLRMRLGRADQILARALAAGVLSDPASSSGVSAARKAAAHRARTRAGRATVYTRRNAAMATR